MPTADPLALDPLSPLPAARAPRWFIPAHSAGSSRPANLRGHRNTTPAPDEVFPAWRRAQREVDRLAGEPPLTPRVLRTTGFLPAELAERIADWFTGNATAPADAVRQSYRALARETARLSEIVRGAPSCGGLGVRVNHVRTASDPYGHAAELCAELREQRSMTLATIAGEAPHPLLGGDEGGVVDQLRVVHDVLGHAALGLGFDLQSEYATWLQCRTLFSRDARAAAFCELVGATTTYIVTGEKPALRADLPPGELVAACRVDGWARRVSNLRRSDGAAVLWCESARQRGHDQNERETKASERGRCGGDEPQRDARLGHEPHGISR